MATTIETKYITDNAVTNPKLDDQPTLTIKGNNTGSTATPQDLTVSQVNTMLDTVTQSEVGAAFGVAPLDGSGKVPYANLPSSLMTFLGNWNASTNTPTLADGTGDTGDTYRVSVAGTQNLGSGAQTFFVGDFIIYNGTIWQRSPAADGVISVNGASGAVTVNAINELTGDATAGPASGSQSQALTLATVNSNVGSFGSASNVSTVTVNAKGLITAASNTSIQIAESQVTNLVSDLAAKQSNVLTTNHILVGSAGVATDVAMSGDATIVASGALTISNNAVSNIKLAQVPAHTYKGNNTASTADPADITATQLTADLNLFTSTLQGLVPASGGGTTNFLRADGTFAAPPNSGGSVTSVSVTTANGVSGSVATATTTPAITLTLGAITPSSVAAVGTVTGSNLSGTNTGDQTITLTGDVTGSGVGSFAATIANSAVTNAKLADMATLTIKGNNTGGSAAPIDLSVSQTQTMLSIPTSSAPLALSAGGTGTSAASANAAFNALSPMTTLGDLIYGGASGAATRLAGDTSNTRKFLRELSSSSVATAPVWDTLVSGDIPSLDAAKITTGTFPIARTTVSTQSISGTSIDWSTGSIFTKTLSANTTFTFSNATSGQTIVCIITNTASNYTVTFPSAKWAGGSQPTQTIGAKTDTWTFVYDGTNYWGSVVQNMS